jgi:putative colanic acid biosynthesis UDP-glucose lipid carrier transferase
MGRHSSSSTGFAQHNEEFLSAFQRLADCLTICLGHYVACVAYGDIWRSQMTMATLVGVIIFNLVAESRGLYRPWRSDPISREITTALMIWISVSVVLFLIAFVTKTTATFSRAVTIGWIGSTVVGLAMWRVGARAALRYLRSHGRNTKNVAIMGVTSISERLCSSLAARPWLGLKIAGMYDDRAPARRHKFAQSPCDFAGSLDDLVRDAREGKIDIVYIGLPLKAEDRIAEALQELADTTATVYLAADLLTYDLMHARWHQIGDIPLVSIYDSPFNGVAGGLKRIEDIVLGSMIMALISIPLLLIAIGVKLTSPGPVFFRQRRYGLNAKEIRVLKFRSMTVCEDGPVVTQATKNDQRVTAFGRFLRKTSLDELPQFIQVLTGEMSIVGPRPHAVAHNQTYRTLIRGYMLRHKVKPGITGWAQVNGFRGETDTLEKMEKRVRYDLDYIQSWDLTWDLRIIFMTIFGSKKNQGAY